MSSGDASCPLSMFSTPTIVSPDQSGTLTSLRTSGLAARYSGSTVTSGTNWGLPLRMTRPTTPTVPSNVSITVSYPRWAPMRIRSPSRM